MCTDTKFTHTHTHSLSLSHTHTHNCKHTHTHTHTHTHITIHTHTHTHTSVTYILSAHSTHYTDTHSHTTHQTQYLKAHTHTHTHTRFPIHSQTDLEDHICFTEKWQLDYANWRLSKLNLYETERGEDRKMDTQQGSILTFIFSCCSFLAFPLLAYHIPISRPFSPGGGLSLPAPSPSPSWPPWSEGQEKYSG